MSTDLTGTVALITRATSGIGKATAFALAGPGAHVLVGGRNAARAPARAEPSVDVISQPSARHGGRDVRGAIPRVALQRRQACVSISRDARNGQHQTTSQHA